MTIGPLKQVTPKDPSIMGRVNVLDESIGELRCEIDKLEEKLDACLTPSEGVAEVAEEHNPCMPELSKRLFTLNNAATTLKNKLKDINQRIDL